MGLGLVVLAAELAVGPGRLSPVPAAAAAVSSVARMVLARRAARTVPGHAREPDLTRLRAWGGPRLEPRAPSATAGDSPVCPFLPL